MFEKLKLCLSNLSNDLLKDKKHFAILLTFSIPLYLYSITKFLDYTFYNLFIWSVIVFLGINIIGTIFINKFNKLKYLFYPASYIVLLCNMYCIFMYGNTFNEPYLVSVLNTNPKEATEYLTTKVDVLKIVYFIIFNIALFGIYKVIYFALEKKGNIFQKGIWVIVGIIAINISNYYPFQIVPFNQFVSLCSFVGGEKIAEMKEDYYLKNNPIELEKNNSTIPYVVLILGESTSKTHMHLYGHDVPNTPLLEQKQKDNEIVVYTNTKSGDTYTIGAVTKLLSFYNNKSTNLYYENANLIDILKVAGYKTFWLSNQTKTGIFSNAQFRISKKCDYSYFTTNNDDRNRMFASVYDEELFPIIDETLSTKVTDKNFFVINLMGTHQDYRFRYPSEYNKFVKENDNKKERMLHHYDNAILYNDFIVTSIINKFKDKNALVIYLSDHGEDVYEEGIERNEHYPNGTEHQKEIPMIFWASNEFKAKYPDKWESIKKHKDEFLSTDDFIYPFLEIIEIKTKENEEL